MGGTDSPGALAGARDLTLSLGGRWFGTYGAAPCPQCQPERRAGQNALTLADGRDGRLLAHCKRAGCAFADIAAAAGLRGGGWRRAGDCLPPALRAAAEAERRAEAERKAEQARRLWREARPVEGTPAATYLGARCIRLDRLPAVLRLPPQPGRLCIAADGDAPGLAAAHALAGRAHALGWQVTIAQPPVGADWADMLAEQAVAA